jgi:asparagine synthetase B (glutamine-hydrolysing)
LQERVEADQRWGDFPAPGQWARYRSLTHSGWAQGAAATRKFYNRHGLELETPYWDRRLIEFVMALPADQLGLPGWDRRLHRQAMTGLLPERVRQRTKRTDFYPLFEKGLLHEERAVIERLLHRPQIVLRQMVRDEWLQDALQRAEPEATSISLLWKCISLELWLHKYWQEPL